MGYIEMSYEVLSNPSYQFILIILVCFGGMIRLFQNSGALTGFGDFMSKFTGGSKMTMLLAWIMEFFVFIDDYLSTLAVTLSMREVTDKNSIPREHLSYQAASMAACLCVLIPFTSWTAFTIGLISEYEMGFEDYLSAVPLMFFPILTVSVCLLIAIGIIPKVGELKKSYDRVEAGGSVLPDEKAGSLMVDLESSGNERGSSCLNFIIPIAVLIIVVMLSDNQLIPGILAAIAVQAVLYLTQKLMTATEFMDNFFEGSKSMCTLAMILFFAFVLNSANQKMGFSEYLIGGISNYVSPAMLPVSVFVIVAFAAFATAGYWVIQVITLPVFIPMALDMNVNISLIIAAMMSGVSFGSTFCFYSDAVFMASAGTGVSNIRQIKVSSPYILTTFALSAILYIVAGRVL